ncbi:hypothetical protein E1264_28505 [Actinomadura sp. KC216]|uniref:hypothetical protein n=1 Tax=Actinomadura sp. KC216 TaxID=2530370 RepID=UPI00104777E9|nr:hypothetical protein [Actinomadura sp. KC216]TDB83422.1 hypothetical protein E1264_28505 [Actinomadura sp. KC216]
MTAADGAQARHREQQIRRLLGEHADRVVPSGDGMAAIRARIASRRPWWRRLIPARKSRTAAPAGPGTAATAERLEGSTAMHTLQSENSPRGRQMAASLALFHLLEQALPDAEWAITEHGHLSGHVSRPGDDAQARADVGDYARFFNAHVQRSQGGEHGEEWVHLSAASVYRGVAVAVWTHVDVRPVAPESSAYGLDLARAVREAGGRS